MCVVLLLNEKKSIFSGYTQFGLSLDRTMTDAMNPYLDSHQDRCLLDEPISSQHSGPIVYFTMNLTTFM